MNGRTSSTLGLIAALIAPASVPLSAASPGTTPVGYFAIQVTKSTWNDLLERTDTRTVLDGSSRASVRSALGQPAQELSPDVWVYDRFEPDLAEARARGCDILVVTFAHEKVADLKFVNRPAAEIIASNVKGERPERYAALR